MDSFSVHWETQIRNLQEIIQFKKLNKDKVILLLGNHDLNYWPGCPQSCSGYQYEKSGYYESIFKAEQEEFQIAYLHGNTLFTHAGVSFDWLLGLDLELESSAMPFDARLNDKFQKEPDRFQFNYSTGEYYGNHPLQSCTWIRPMALITSRLEGFNQVVGHTTNSFVRKHTFADGTHIHFVDALPYEYLVIKDGEFIIKQT